MAEAELQRRCKKSTLEKYDSVLRRDFSDGGKSRMKRLSKRLNSVDRMNIRRLRNSESTKFLMNFYH